MLHFKGVQSETTMLYMKNLKTTGSLDLKTCCSPFFKLYHYVNLRSQSIYFRVSIGFFLQNSIFSLEEQMNSRMKIIVKIVCNKF